MDKTVAPGDRVRDTQEPLELKLRAYTPLSSAECEFLAELKRDDQAMPADIDIIGQGDTYERVFILLDGWAIRHRTLSDGRRQIINFVLPGDFIGLHAITFQQSDHFITTLTPARVAQFDPILVLELFKQFPRLAAALAWCAAREESLIAERVASVGRRSAYERMAHLLVELLTRLKAVRMASANSFNLPVTQEVLADALGLSIVHVSRTLRRLRQDGLIQPFANRIEIPSLDRLEQAAEFDRLFLHQGPPPRRISRELAKMAEPV